MLIKEYRIPLPMTVEEYKIAQLYMIAKKSREETKGTESGVEILINEPYTDGPGGNGQFTHKIYHVGSHLPGWFKSLLPKSALTVEEEAWNSYPYTKTRFKCPFVEKFSLEIETYYTPDGGDQENVFKLNDSDIRNRVVDLIDVVKDQEGTIYEDPDREDPMLYTSDKTGRGPLSSDWIEEYSEACRGKSQPTPEGKSVMCAYKLCKVEFRYWGMQSKIERFIHDTALRKTMLKAHSQAWTWQDEWHGLTMEDIRAIEKETQDLLKKKMANPDACSEDGEYKPGYDLETDLEVSSNNAKAQFCSIEYSDADVPNIIPKTSERVKRKSLDIGIDEAAEEEEEFFDCNEQWDESSSLAKWSSMELETLDTSMDHANNPNQVEPPVSFRRVQSLHERSSTTPIDLEPQPLSARPNFMSRPVIDVKAIEDQCPTQVLILVIHGGSVLDGPLDASVRKSDVTTFRGAFETLIRTHYPGLVGQVIVKCVACPAVCTEALAVLSSLSPYSFDVIPALNGLGKEDFVVSNDRLPIGTIPIFAGSSPEYQSSVSKMVSNANEVFASFLQSEEGSGFCGHVCLIGDSMGSILAYDALCRDIKRSSSEGSVNEDLNNRRSPFNNGGESIPSSPKIRTSTDHEGNHQPPQKQCHLSALSIRKENSSTSEILLIGPRFDFDVSDFFAFGSPLGLLLAYRKIQQSRFSGSKAPIPRPSVQQMYNLFHPSDPIGCRIEPLLSAPFSRVPPVNVSRYQKYPMGDGACYSLIEFIQSNCGLFADYSSIGPSGGATCLASINNRPNLTRRPSEDSITSGVVDAQQFHTINVLKPKWWGGRRIDYALYCPEGLSNFPTNSLPHLFHSSYWESADVISFVLRQLVRAHDIGLASTNDLLGGGGLNHPMGAAGGSLDLLSQQPREKWIKKRTSVKIRQGAPNHRGNDVIVKEGNDQIVSGRFSYGPLDMAALTGEKVDIHLMKDPSVGDWTLVTTEVTDKHGRVCITLPREHNVGYGLYPVRMVVRGDHTCLQMTLAVVPPKTETVVFSIDGSFAASVSVTGKDPKVKPGAVDIVRHWQELGYLIVYVTGRPDMQLQRVVAWLTQHNFPKGLVSFADGFTTDPLKHKADYLKSLITDQDIVVHAAYGSNKDIAVYSSLSIKSEQILIFGKPSKKQSQLQVTWLTDGYAEHLANLTTPGGSRPAQGNARMVIPKGQTFSHPGLQRRRTFKSASRTTSYPVGTVDTAGSNSQALASTQGRAKHELKRAQTLS